MPREGHDAADTIQGSVASIFQSTCPVRGTTHKEEIMATYDEISIHVPREGHDSSFRSLATTSCNFNPRAP